MKPTIRTRTRIDTARRTLNGLIATQLAGSTIHLDGKSCLILGVDKHKTEFAVYAKVGRCERYLDALALRPFVETRV